MRSNLSIYLNEYFMKTLSFDVGMKNLAYCIIDNEQIAEWDIISVPSSYNEQLCVNLVKELDKYPSMLDCDQVVIEKQPAKNNKMRIMEHLLTSYFVIKGINDKEKPMKKVKVYSAKFKLGSATVKGKQNYSARKKLAVTRCAEFLKQSTQQEQFVTKFNKSKKKDDLADCFLQALSFVDSKLFAEIQTLDLDSVCGITARKPTKVQEKKGYSKANIKWFLMSMKFKDQDHLVEMINENKKLKAAVDFWYPKQGIDQTLRECSILIT